MADYGLPPLDRGERLYRALLALYPPRFRRTFALDLVETFRDERRSARRDGMSPSQFWLEAIQDVVVHAAAEWLYTIWSLRAVGSARNQEDSPMLAMFAALRGTELKYAARRLARAPTFTIAAIVVLALGISATTAVFSVVNGVLLEPMPFPHADRLVSLRHTLELSGPQEGGLSDANVLLYQSRARSFDGIAAWRFGDGNLSPVSSADRAERLSIGS